MRWSTSRATGDDWLTDRSDTGELASIDGHGDLRRDLRSRRGGSLCSAGFDVVRPLNTTRSGGSRPAFDLRSRVLAGFSGEDGGKLLPSIHDPARWTFGVETEWVLGLDVEPGHAASAGGGDVEGFGRQGLIGGDMNGVDGAPFG